MVSCIAIAHWPAWQLLFFRDSLDLFTGAEVHRYAYIYMCAYCQSESCFDSAEIALSLKSVVIHYLGLQFVSYY